MKIILLRHGQPDINEAQILTARELYKWIHLYNNAGIKQGNSPTSQILTIAKNCNSIVCSDYPRSIESVHILGINNIHHIDPIFREAGLPYANWGTVKARPIVWVTLFRILWFMGYSSNSESHSQAKQRSIKATRKLENLARESESVMLVGHGFINNFIAKNLLSTGWQGPSTTGKKYWDMAVYVKKITENKDPRGKPSPVGRLSRPSKAGYFYSNLS